MKIDVESIKDLDTRTLEVLWASLLSMVEENHSVQDQLDEEQWNRAEELYKIFTQEMDSRESN